MQGGSFIIAGSTRADDDVRVASAPHGQLLDQDALKPLRSGKPLFPGVALSMGAHLQIGFRPPPPHAGRELGLGEGQVAGR